MSGKKFQSEIVVELQTESQNPKLFTVIYEKPSQFASVIRFVSNGKIFRSKKLILKQTFNSIAQNGSLQLLESPSKKTYSTDTRIKFIESDDTIMDTTMDREYIGFICVPNDRNPCDRDFYQIQTVMSNNFVKFEPTRLPNSRLHIKWSPYGESYENKTMYVECPGMKLHAKNDDQVYLLGNNIDIEGPTLEHYDVLGDCVTIKTPKNTGAIIIPLNKKYSTIIGIFQLKQREHYVITIPFKGNGKF